MGFVFPIFSDTALYNGDSCGEVTGPFRFTHFFSANDESRSSFSFTLWIFKVMDGNISTFKTLHVITIPFVSFKTVTRSVRNGLSLLKCTSFLSLDAVSASRKETFK
jgi:hypothetical protein